MTRYQIHYKTWHSSPQHAPLLPVFLPRGPSPDAAKSDLPRVLPYVKVPSLGLGYTSRHSQLFPNRAHVLLDAVCYKNAIVSASCPHLTTVELTPLIVADWGPSCDYTSVSHYIFGILFVSCTFRTS